MPAKRHTVMHLVRADGDHIAALGLDAAAVGPGHVPAFPHDPKPELVMRVSGKPARRRDHDAINALQASACDVNAVIFGLLHGTIQFADPALSAVQMIALALKPTQLLVCANDASHVVQTIFAVPVVAFLDRQNRAERDGCVTAERNFGFG
jgi:hypothetical protein